MSILQRLYDSEINAVVYSFWTAGSACTWATS
jgi:hypothetical protein